MSDFQGNSDYLEQSKRFLDMPEKIQEWIRASEHATSDFAIFF